MNMKERLARRLMQQYWARSRKFWKIEDWGDMADAALDELREMDEAMLAAAFSSWGRREPFKAIWRAAIDKAREG